MLPKHALEREPQPARRPLRRLVQIVRLPLVPAISQVLERVPRHQEHGLGRAARPPQRGRKQHEPHFDDAVRGPDVVIGCVPDGLVRCPVDDGERVRVPARGGLRDETLEFGPRGRRGREHVVPEVGVRGAAETGVEVVGVRGGEALEPDGGAGEELEGREGRVWAGYLRA